MFGTKGADYNCNCACQKKSADYDFRMMRKTAEIMDAQARDTPDSINADMPRLACQHLSEFVGVSQL
jgi:hypothetical protein